MGGPEERRRAPGRAADAVRRCRTGFSTGSTDPAHRTPDGSESGSIQGMPPAQPRKACEPAVEGNPFTILLHGQGRVVGVGDQVPPGIDLATELREPLPMPLSRIQDVNPGMGTELLDEPKREMERRGLLENPGVGHHPHAPAQGQIRDGDPLMADEGGLDPMPNRLMRFRIFPVEVNQDVDVQQHHGSSMTSRRADEFFRSTPGRTPSPEKVVHLGTGSLGNDLGWLSRTTRSASSTTSLSVQPRRIDTCLAFRSSVSSIVIVVRMHQDV